MKKLMTLVLCLFLLLLCSCEKATSEKDTTNKETSETLATNEKTTTQHETTAPSTTDFSLNIDKNDPYYNVIKEYEDDDIQLLRAEHYVYYDIDGNGTKELLMGWGGSLERVYTIRNGVAVQQEEFYVHLDTAGPTVLFENGTIRGEGSGEGGTLSNGYYRFEAGELKWKISLNIESGEYLKRYPNDPMKSIPISKEEYDRLKKEMEGDGQLVELDWKPLAEYGR